MISVEKDTMKLELVPRGGGAVMIDMEGQYFAPIVKVVIFDDFFVFLGAKTWYRFEGMTSFDRNIRRRARTTTASRSPRACQRRSGSFSSRTRAASPA